MTEPDPGTSSQADSLGAPEHERSGSNVDEAVEKAEQGSQVEGVHTPSGEAASGDSRVEQMRDVDVEGTPDANPGETVTPPEPGPSPTEVGSGGAQRVVGARVSDRVAGGESAPGGPPFDSEGQRRST